MRNRFPKERILAALSDVHEDPKDAGSRRDHETREPRLPSKPADVIRLLENILDVIPNCLIAVDRNGQIVYINNQYCELLGLEKSHVLGRHVTSVVSPETQLHLVARGAPPTHNHSLVVRGHKLIVNQVPIRDGDDVVGAVGIALFTEAEQILALARRLFSIDIRAQARPRTWLSRYTVSDIIGSSREVINLRERILRAARTRATILIVGESGTGKELVAHAIHSASSRADRPFVHVNCAAIPQNLLETELFGYDGGSFTGARAKGNPGKFELANGGTIFLDEIGDMPMEMQSALLRILQEREVVRVGGTQPFPLDIRVVCATHRDLSREIEQGRFRADLFYRINVFRIDVPALRERPDDIPQLARHILAALCEENELEAISSEPEVLEHLMVHDWPGNVRELHNVLEHAVHVLDGPVLKVRHLPAIAVRRDVQLGASNRPFRETIASAERLALVEALARSEGNKSKAAAILGIDRTSLYKKLRTYDLI